MSELTPAAGLKTIVNAVIYSVERLGNVIVLSLFFLSLFALTGLQLYMGVLSQACIEDFDPSQVRGVTNQVIKEDY